MSEEKKAMPKAVRRKRNDILQFRATEAEARRARKRAAQAGMSLSAYLRSSSLNPALLPQGTVLQLANLCDRLQFVLRNQREDDAAAHKLCVELRRRLEALNAQ